MRTVRASSTHLALLTTISVLSIASYARAGEDELAATNLNAIEIDAPLPTSLDNWSVAEDELELREFSSLSLAALPQGRLAAKKPFIDFDGLELGGYVGMVKYSSDFLAGVSYILAVTSRVPVPGIALGEWGLWAELFMGSVDRNLPFYYVNQAKTWFGGSLGADFMVVKGEVAFIRLQAGAMYAYWNKTDGLANGIGVMGGVQLGFHWIRGNDKSSITFNPQMSYNGKSYILFIPVGFSIDF